MSHTLLVTPHWQARGVVLLCTCGGLREYIHEGSSVFLDDLNRIAHEHIERVYPVREVTGTDQGYRADSIVRSADELVSLEHLQQ